MSDEMMTREQVEDALRDARSVANCGHMTQGPDTVKARLAATCLTYMDAHARVDALCDDADAESAKMEAAWPNTKIGPLAVSSRMVRRANALRGEGETDAK